MGYQTWHTYGYGVCVSDIVGVSVERLQTLLALAPVFNTKVKECEITEPVFEDYLDFDQDYRLGLATILKEVILEDENVNLDACDDFDGKDYLLYGVCYPWSHSTHRVLMTEEAVEELFRKYVSILTDKAIEIDYQSVENGG